MLTSTDHPPRHQTRQHPFTDSARQCGGFRIAKVLEPDETIDLTGPDGMGTGIHGPEQGLAQHGFPQRYLCLARCSTS